MSLLLLFNQLANDPIHTLFALPSQLTTSVSPGARAQDISRAMTLDNKSYYLNSSSITLTTMQVATDKLVQKENTSIIKVDRNNTNAR